MYDIGVKLQQIIYLKTVIFYPNVAFTYRELKVKLRGGNSLAIIW